MSASCRLVTTLTDPQRYPVQDFPDLYAGRWQIETAIGDVEPASRRTGCGASLPKPDMVRQEVYGLLRACSDIGAGSAQRNRVKQDPPRLGVGTFTCGSRTRRQGASSRRCWTASSYGHGNCSKTTARQGDSTWAGSSACWRATPGMGMNGDTNVHTTVNRRRRSRRIGDQDPGRQHRVLRCGHDRAGWLCSGTHRRIIGGGLR